MNLDVVHEFRRSILSIRSSLYLLDLVFIYSIKSLSIRTSLYLFDLVFYTKGGSRRLADVRCPLPSPRDGVGERQESGADVLYSSLSLSSLGYRRLSIF